ncbi:unnamed protein product [Gongylonema pulchrum]|uniref:Dynein associated protein domain-containing protein n=1 Tax=Gongylonema pulchrum TaxID=637853 RepID=A0A3P7P6C8_9BILA|nr:unnamed protein product [Gongylonema pulchrum]
MLAELLNQKAPTNGDFVPLMHQHISSLESEIFYHAVRLCSVERLSRLAQLQTDIAKEERMIDQYIDLLKSDKFDENTSCDSVDKGIAFFEVCYILSLVFLIFFFAAD